MGSDAGEAVPTEGGYRGRALNVAARLCAVAAGGEVLVTEGLAHLAQPVKGIQFGSARLMQVKGVVAPVRVVSVVPDTPLPPIPRQAKPPGRGRRRWMLPAVLAITVLVAGAVAVVASRGGASGRGVPVRINSVAVIDPASGRVLQDIPVGDAPWAITVGSGAVWVANAGQGADSVTRIDLTTMQPKTLGLGGSPEAIAAGQGSIWAYDTDDGSIYQINPNLSQLGTARKFRLPACSYKTAAGIVPTGCEHGAIAAGYGSIWVSDGKTGLYTLNPTTGRFHHVPGYIPAHAIAIGNGSIYTSDAANLARTEPHPPHKLVEQILTPASGSHPTLGLAVTPDAIWAVSPDQGRLYRADPSSLVSTGVLPLRPTLNDITVGAGSLWVTDQAFGTVTQINPNTTTVTRTIPLGHAPTAIAYANGKLWVTIQDRATATNQL